MNDTDKLQKAIKGCIKSLEEFDDQQRELAKNKKITIDSFSEVMKRNCDIIKTYFLEKQLPGLAMRIQKVDTSTTTPKYAHQMDKWE